MKKKLNAVLLVSILTLLTLFIILLTLFFSYVSLWKTIKFPDVYFPLSRTLGGTDKLIMLICSLILSFFALVFACIFFFLTNRADLSELLSSTKEKRLAKKEAKRQEKLSELQAKKEELEKTINDLKKE